MFTTLLYVLFVVAAFSLIYWGFTRMALPEPVKTILMVVLGLVGLWLLWSLIASGGHPVWTSRP